MMLITCIWFYFGIKNNFGLFILFDLIFKEASKKWTDLAICYNPRVEFQHHLEKDSAIGYNFFFQEEKGRLDHNHFRLR